MFKSRADGDERFYLFSTARSTWRYAVRRTHRTRIRSYPAAKNRDDRNEVKNLLGSRRE